METLSIGEMNLLRTVIPRRAQGEPFDYVAELSRGHGSAHLAPPSLYHDAYRHAVDGLLAKGMLREEGSGSHSITGEGERA